MNEQDKNENQDIIEEESKDEDQELVDGASDSDVTSEEDMELISPSSKDYKSSVTRGAEFRKKLLKRIPKLEFPDSLKKDDLNLTSILSPLLDINADKFIDELKKIVPEDK